MDPVARRSQPTTLRPVLLPRILAAVAILIAVQLAFAAGVSAQDAPVPELSAVPDDAATLADLVNSYRVENGLDALIVSADFSANTQPFADTLMAANAPVEPPPGFFNACPRATLFHDNGASIAGSAPVTPLAWAENLAYTCNIKFDEHAEVLFQTLRNSPPHNAVMLDPKWTHMASAAARWGHSTVAVNRFAVLPRGIARVAVGATVTCLSGSGRVDFSISNRGEHRETFVVRLGRITREADLAPGQSTTVTVTGRPNGAHEASTATAARRLWRSTLNVNCHPDPAPTRGVGVTVTCLGGSGRVDLMIEDQATGGTFDVRIGTVTRPVQAVPGLATAVVVTGRPEGDLPVSVTRNGVTVHRSVHTVDCVKDQVLPVVVTTSCLASNGRIDVSIKNDGRTRSYDLAVGSVTRTVTVEGAETLRTSVTGRPDGTHAVVVTAGGIKLHREDPSISC